MVMTSDSEDDRPLIFTSCREMFLRRKITEVVPKEDTKSPLVFTRSPANRDMVESTEDSFECEDRDTSESSEEEEEEEEEGGGEEEEGGEEGEEEEEGGGGGGGGEGGGDGDGDGDEVMEEQNQIHYSESEDDCTSVRVHQNVAESAQSAAVAPDTLTLTLTLTDPDLLDCPICFIPLTIPVFQCDNGHMVCSGCCDKINNACPSCSLSIGRSRAVEKILESVRISCRNIIYGCKETMIYSKKHEHEHMCTYEPCLCPHPGCDFMAYYKQLYVHYNCKHVGSAISFDYGSIFTVPIKLDVEFAILQERVENTLFVLSCGVQRIGIVASITCVAPSSIKEGISYNLTARNGKNIVNLKSCIESMPLLIPSEILDSSGRHNLQISIQSG